MAVGVGLAADLFLSTLPARGATSDSVAERPVKHKHFYPRSPRGERPISSSCTYCAGRISIHAPREGSDKSSWAHYRESTNFYPRSPRGERRNPPIFPPPEEGNFYPRSPRGERRVIHYRSDWLQTISIHAPREGSDTWGGLRPGLQDLFLSTLPARGATQRRPSKARPRQFLSTLPARGATADQHGRRCRSRISIHAPREGSDSEEGGHLSMIAQISIHAPREGSDLQRLEALKGNGYFYPRSPRGERLLFSQRSSINLAFLSTLPARGATLASRWTYAPHKNFYPRSPRGERLTTAKSKGVNALFLSTLPARGATPGRCNTHPTRGISIHAPREGSDTS